ncbi:hypothetical protein ABW09_23410 [Pluralibacter gergoviae]|nr:hypothetical protein ABW09_23410 [Pluralibacter gergoviae]
MTNPNYVAQWPLYANDDGAYVRALPIKSIDYAIDGSANAEFDGAYDEQYISAQFVSVFKPQAGGYLFRSQYGELLYLSKADFEAEYSASAGESVSWGDIEGKPATFPPAIGTTATTAMAGNAKPATAVAADTAAKLATARNIGGVAFDGSANINLPGVNAAGNQSTTGNAATATKLATARTITLTGAVTGTATFDGSGNITINTTAGT